MLERINSPKDLKELNFEDLNKLAKEISFVLLNKAKLYGGHVGSNLGVIELSIALHYVFNTPTDKVIFDVSHQCYTHKILTGRKDAFLKEELFSTVSGFTNPLESEYDLFRVGHTATSISLACGLAKARQLNGSKEKIIVVIGDAALGGGEALEGLNFAASEIKDNLIIIVNDNQMSIAENHGGLYRHLAVLRASKGKSTNNIFIDLGFEYYFIEKGNDIESIVHKLKSIKDINKPIIVHICTNKGNGYKYAENDKETWHWRRPFDIETGELLNPYNGPSYDNILNDYLLNKMKKDKRVVAFAAGVPLTSGFTKEKRAIAGNQFVDVGIMEEHAIAMIAGVAANGGKPVFTTDCTFYQRVYDQVSQELCINKLAATMLIRNAGIWGLTDITHLGFFDIAIFGNIPNLVYLAPTNKQEYIEMLDWSIEQNKFPVAIRIPRFVHNAEYGVINNFDIINKFQICESGEKVAIIALGNLFQIGQEVYKLLKTRLGLNSTLINPRYASGIDEELLYNLKDNHSLFITLEDGIIEGGFGSKVASFMGKFPHIMVKNYGLNKEFLDRYSVDKVLEANRLVPKMIVEDIYELSII